MFYYGQNAALTCCVPDRRLAFEPLSCQCVVSLEQHTRHRRKTHEVPWWKRGNNINWTSIRPGGRGILSVALHGRNRVPALTAMRVRDLCRFFFFS